jgi:ABC-type nitrate/sulfonate/bicarbonate transport system substrate-binding protein
VAIAAEFNDPIYTLVARPEIGRIADLKGKIVGMADPDGSIAYSMRKLLALHGVSENELRVKTIGGTPARLACLRRGECVAVPLGQPQDLLAQSEGYRLLGSSNDAVPAYLYTVTAVRRSWAAANSEALIRYVRALAGSFSMIRDRGKRDAVIQAIVEMSAVPPAVAAGVLELYAGKNVLPSRGEIELAGLERVIAFMGESGQLKAPLPGAERFVELRYLQLAGIQ